MNLSKRIILCLIFLMLLACNVAESPSFSNDQLDLALIEISAERTQIARPTVANIQVTLDIYDQSSPFPLVTPIIAPNDPHDDGTYVVGVEIAAGLWRSISNEQRFCYWARRKYDGILLGSYYGLPGKDLRIFESDYEVELDGCGTWIFMGTE